MAVINSVVVGRGKKSVGEVTLAYQRQRTIARRRVTENKSNTPAQAKQRGKFGSFVAVMYPHIEYIKQAYQKSKYGSQFNNFTKINWNKYHDNLASDHMGLNQKFLTMLVGGNKEFENLEWYTYGDFSCESYPLSEPQKGSKLTIPATLNNERVGYSMHFTFVTEYTDNWRFNVFAFDVSDGKERLIVSSSPYPLYKEGETLINWESTSKPKNINPHLESAASSIRMSEDGVVTGHLVATNLLPVQMDKEEKVGNTCILIPILSRYGKIVKFNTIMSTSIVAKSV